MFGLPGLRNLNQYFKVVKQKKFQNSKILKYSRTPKLKNKTNIFSISVQKI